MTWTVRDGISVESIDIDGTRIVEVSLSDHAVQGFCLGLSMLWTGVIGSFLLGEDGTVNLSMMAHTLDGRLGAHIEWRGGRASLALPPRDLEYWLCFSLKAVRDGVAEVDHLDLDALPSDDHSRHSVVVKFPASVPAVSATEARRRLGL